MELLNYLQKFSYLNDEISHKIDQVFETFEFKKGEILVEENTKKRNIIYFEKGITRAFYHKEDKEITHFFFAETSFYLPMMSILLQKNPIFNIQAMEDGVARVVPFSQIEQLAEEYLILYKLINQELTRFSVRVNTKMLGIQFQSAQERYELLLAEYPNILQRVPLGYIASFLGITQQRLSVIRGFK